MSGARSRGGAIVEDVAALLGDAVDPVAADFGGERKHAAEDFAERGAVVLRDPAGELEELGGEECGVVEEALDFFYFDAITWMRVGCRAGRRRRRGAAGR